MNSRQNVWELTHTGKLEDERMQETKDEETALEGGKPARSEPLPLEFPGAQHYDQQEVDAVVRVLKSRSPYRNYGLDPQREVGNFEKEFATFLGVPYAVAVSSGTGALRRYEKSAARYGRKALLPIGKAYRRSSCRTGACTFTPTTRTSCNTPVSMGVDFRGTRRKMRSRAQATGGALARWPKACLSEASSSPLLPF
jgi:cystathionine beta-lyase/cystathionine gamma-synthase